jgi:opacity protein-like surface antigen
MHMTRLPIVLLLAIGLLVARPAPAEADVTAFLGFSTTPETRSTRGFAAGLNLLILGFEFEYARTVEQELEGVPGLTTSMFNAMVTTPTSDLQFYATAGAGFYRERIVDETETSVGTNVGGGVKVGLAGPIKLRLDYRVFNLRGNPLHKNPQRFYAGVSLAF